MTEEEWLVCNDPLALGRFAHGKANPQRFNWLALDWGQRNRRSFCEEVSNWLDKYSLWLHSDGLHPNQLNLPDGFYPLSVGDPFDAYGWMFFNALRRLDNPMRAAAVAGECARDRAGISCTRSPVEPLKASQTHKGRSKSKRAAQAAREQSHFEEKRRQKAILREQVGGEFCTQFRDVSGNPFRPVAVDPAWRSAEVLAIATAVYADRAFDRMPILVDALEEAGCVNADVLVHCRSDCPHVRGCWVVDLLLGHE